MGVLADEYIRLRADTSHMSRDVRKAGADAGRTFGGTFAGAAKKLLAGGALFAGVALVAKFLGEATAAARESNKVGNTTAQIIKSTGGAAKVSAGQVSALATAISLKTGKDDEAIQTGANLLLTFKNVRNEVGAGAKIFDRATAAAVDLSAAGFGSIDSASKMLGKALNDPLKGLTALGRAGVTFTQQQKDQIKVMVESGNVLGAQKLIMKEVESQVGGVARAQATWAEKAKVAFENVKETVGDFLLKGLEPVSRWFVETGFPAIEDFFKKISKDKNLKAALTDLKDALTALTSKDFKGSLDSLATSLPPVIIAISNAITKYKEFSDVVDKFENKSFGEGDKRGGPVGQLVKDFGAGGTIEQALIQFRGFIVRHVQQAWTNVKASFVENHAAVLADVSRFWSAVKSAARAAWDWVKTKIADVWAAIKTGWEAAHTWLKTKWTAFWTAIKNTAQAAWDAVKAKIAAVWASIKARWEEAHTWVKSKWSSFWTTIKNGARDAMQWVQDKISTVLTKIKNAFQTAKDNIKRIWDGLKGVVSKPVEWIRNNVYNTPLVDVWNKVAGLVNGPKLSNFATGGVIPGYEPGRDSVPIMAGRGEAIMRPEWTRAVGKDWVDKANKAARSGKRSLHDFLGESVPGQGGGIGWLKGLVSGVTSKVGSMKDWLLGGLRAAAGKLLDPVKGLINKAMPSSGVGTTVGNIGKKAIDLVLDKIKKVDVIPDLGGGPLGSAIASGGWASIYKILRAAGARSFTTYPGHDQGASRSRDIWPASAGGRIAETARRISSIWYVIWNRRIASITTGRRWIGYHGSDPHTSHVHVTLRPGVRAAMGGVVGNGLASGGIVKGGHGGLNTWIGEGGRDELVSPIPKGWSPANQDAKMDRLIAAIERNGLGGTTVNLGGVHNPLPEKPSITVNKVMQRVAGLGLV